MSVFEQNLRHIHRLLPCLRLQQWKSSLVRYSSSTNLTGDSIDSILSKPTWSVQSLFPDKSSVTESATVTRKELHHLLRLSALPQPSNAAEEKEMLQTLESQIHFVKEIQHVDTSNVSPLCSIRDETEMAQREHTIGLSHLKPTLDRETRVGRTRRIRLQKAEKLVHPDGETCKWDALDAATKKMGRYFVVQSGSD
ncbi:hypothetical protein VTO42DRAFT_1169 [Malbranchea cinnamomea]